MRIGMRIGTPSLTDASLHYRNGDLAHTVESCARLGYDCVELDLKDPAEIDRRALRRVLDANGVDWCGMGTGRVAAEDGLTFTDPDPEMRRKAIERICRLIELGAEFGAIPMIGRVRCDTQQLADPRTQRVRMMDGLHACAEFAEKCGGTAMLENIARYINPSLNTVSETLAAIEEIGSPRIKMMYDTYHAWLEERSFYGSLVACGRALCYVHISDSNREAPGYGLIDYSEVIGVLHAMSYAGPIVLEVLMTPDPETVARDSIQLLGSLCRKHGVARPSRA
jgi:5-keto-L-gluconate epimerase